MICINMHDILKYALKEIVKTKKSEWPYEFFHWPLPKALPGFFSMGVSFRCSCVKPLAFKAKPIQPSLPCQNGENIFFHHGIPFRHHVNDLWADYVKVCINKVAWLFPGVWLFNKALYLQAV